MKSLKERYLMITENSIVDHVVRNKKKYLGLAGAAAAGVAGNEYLDAHPEAQGNLKYFAGNASSILKSDLGLGTKGALIKDAGASAWDLFKDGKNPSDMEPTGIFKSGENEVQFKNPNFSVEVSGANNDPKLDLKWGHKYDEGSSATQPAPRTPEAPEPTEPTEPMELGPEFGPEPKPENWDRNKKFADALTKAFDDDIKAENEYQASLDKPTMGPENKPIGWDQRTLASNKPSLVDELQRRGMTTEAPNDQAINPDYLAGKRTMPFEWRTPEEQQQIVERLQHYNQPIPSTYKG